ncbi:MAG: SRPBCC family protein [Miltoncostaeaceae bacterium]
MARYVTSVRSPWTPEDAFDFLADLRNFERWDPGVKSSRQVAGDSVAIGARYEVTVTGSRLVYTLEELQRPTRVVAAATTKRLTSRDVVTVAAEGGGSVCTYDATLTLNGAFRLLEPVMALVFRRVGDRAARGLAEALEGVIVPPG